MKKENVAIKNNSHSRMFLSGISTFGTQSGVDPRLQASGMTNQINCHVEKVLFSISTLEKTQGGDPGQKPFRMTTNFCSNFRDDAFPPGARITSRGFTLIELLVVVLIIGILVAVALPQYQKAVKKAKYAKMKVLAKQIGTAQNLYYQEHGTYATLLSQLDLNIPNVPASTTKQCYKWIDSDAIYVEGLCASISNLGIMKGNIRLNFPKVMDQWNGYGFLVRAYNKKVPAGLVCTEGRTTGKRDPHCTGRYLYEDATAIFYTMD